MGYQAKRGSDITVDGNGKVLDWSAMQVAGYYPGYGPTHLLRGVLVLTSGVVLQGWRRVRHNGRWIPHNGRWIPLNGRWIPLNGRWIPHRWPRPAPPEIQDKKPHFQCNLYQESGVLYLVSGGIALCTRYAMPGTDAAYGATSEPSTTPRLGVG
eukprot:3464157-Rhodomonas_salina.2